MAENNIYIFDTSALLTYLEDEDGADIIEKLLTRAAQKEIEIIVSFLSFTEVYYITAREKGEIEALKRIYLLRFLPMRISHSNDTITLLAGEIKAKNSLSLADAFIASLNSFYHGKLVHKDPEFSKIQPKIDEIRLPFK